MITGFIDGLPNIQGGFFAVERRPMPADYGAVDLTKPPAGVWHTTEGTQEVPAYGGSAPHLTAGRSGLYQHVGFGRTCGALRNAIGGVETNRWVRLQVEIVGFCNLQPWVPATSFQRDLIASIAEFAEKELGIPEKHVFPDDLRATPLLPGQIWATENNPRRNSGHFGKTPGWYYHIELPENTHWDCGSLSVTSLLRQEPLPDYKLRYTLKAVDGHDSVELTDPLTLIGIGRALASDKDLRSAVKNHKDEHHRVVLARNRVKVP